MKHILSASLLALMLFPTTVRAQSRIEPPPPQAAAPTTQVFGEPIARPSMLAPLYVSLASLQAYDGYSTLRGVNNGWPAVLSSLKSLLETGQAIPLESCSG